MPLQLIHFRAVNAVIASRNVRLNVSFSTPPLPAIQAFWLQVKIKLNIERTDRGVRVVATGDYVDIIETTLVPRERIGRFVADLILDRAYLKGAQIVINNAIAFEAFDANDDFDAFEKLIDAA
jgi:hypothetical protein